MRPLATHGDFPDLEVILGEVTMGKLGELDKELNGG